MPVVELSAQVGELPNNMDLFLIKKMVDHCLNQKDYDGAVRLWEAGVRCKPGDVNALLELSQTLVLAGDQHGARQRLAQAQALDPHNEAALALYQQAAAGSRRRKKRH